jgi:NAD(P)-dependent dehydrogenase (short-subunit alcohol dehydrogenase family)
VLTYSVPVNNAGSGVYAGTLEHTQEQIEELFKTNVFGPIAMTQAVVPHMPSGGRIINITSIAAKIGMTLMPIYGSAKAAVDSLTYAWAAEVRFVLVRDIRIATNSSQTVRKKPRNHCQLRCSRSSWNGYFAERSRGFE